jgi:hypothetical protein
MAILKVYIQGEGAPDTQMVFLLPVNVQEFSHNLTYTWSLLRKHGVPLYLQPSEVLDDY